MTIECNMCDQPVMGPYIPVLKVSRAWVDGVGTTFENNFFKYKFTHHDSHYTDSTVDRQLSTRKWCLKKKRCKKWRVQRHQIVKCELWLSSWMWKVLLDRRLGTIRLSPYPRLIRVLDDRHYQQITVNEFFGKQDAEWYRAGIHKLILRYNKCLNEQVDYVEK